jgi:ribonuclease PH
VRHNGRATDQMRIVSFERNYTRHAAGSVLAEFGDTKVICTAVVEEGVPRFLKGSKRGWLTAEYGMLPSSTNTRNDREAVRGKQNGRSIEIQRLIGRSLRAMVDMENLGERTIKIDCDVIQADGGTRTASISGGAIAICDALRSIGKLEESIDLIASVSVGMTEGEILLDLDYIEDSGADTDMNFVFLENHGFIEIQGTGEKKAFTGADFSRMIARAEKGIENILSIQRKTLAELPE